MTDWFQQALRLADLWKEEPLHPAAIHVIEQFKVSWGVACSGGADSLALLLLLWARYPQRRGRLRVLHFNHGLRGANADADAEFVRVVANGLGLEFRLGRADFSPGTKVGEGELRAARLKFFSEADCAVVCLGHHANDVAETQLMRLTRGSGAEGFAAPRPVSQPARNSPVHLRPMLEWSREAIVDGLRQLEIPWREDASNQTGDYFRNRIRHQVWPALQEASHGDALQGAIRARQLLEEDADALDSWLEAVYPAKEHKEHLAPNGLRGKPRALWRRALVRWLARMGLLENLSAGAVDDLLLSWIEESPLRFSVGKGKFLVADDHGVIRLRLDERAPSWRAHSLTPGSGLALPDAGLLMCHRASLDDSLNAQIRSGQFSEYERVYLNLASLDDEPLTVRLWQPGDRYRPLGSPGMRKLQDCFTDRKIPERERKRLPVVCDSHGAILWVPGLPPSESARIVSACKTALMLTYRGI
ncbi:tRNA lysidine(34) synthetase TilS [Cerasicoccus fimbriatus]|uniref:tRNA lysidine(34) synthetase TilS n=1 Tax=Cerasicoccus fimbriatus TaxID=3014554 RepID=UPI0022B36E5D|nr:tRNA lysidine(34) synthetase TilS [Cerasicoccus sp. TK19100]